jgi:hypothetical protein
LRALEARVTWVRPENFHITLKFLGEVNSDSVEVLKILGAQVAASAQRFELTFDTVGAFPTVHRPRVLWIGASSVPAEILFLHERLERELTKMGFEEEERFTLSCDRWAHQGRAPCAGRAASSAHLSDWVICVPRADHASDSDGEPVVAQRGNLYPGSDVGVLSVICPLSILRSRQRLG